MKNPTRLTSILLACTLFACTDDGEPQEQSTQSEAADDLGDGDGDDEADGEVECWDVPQRCLDFITCVGAILPNQLAAVEEKFGPNGSCWCGTSEQEALDCYNVCTQQLAAAIEDNPTEPLCHGQYCPIEDLDPDQPYGPVIDGTCPDYKDTPQLPLDHPFGLPGSLCAPKCSGVANYCPEHTQTIAQGTCWVSVGSNNYCVTRCWVEPLIFGPTGTQCQCGARCQPFGPPDADGNARGICTFE